MTFIVNTDGGARGNPGPAAVGYVIKKDGEVVKEAGVYIGETTNNVAEYEGVIHALTALEELLGNRGEEEVLVSFYLDSNLVVNQLKGTFKIKQPHLQTLASKVITKIGELKLKASFNYVPRAQNAQADHLVNQALDAQLA